jgi:hypothetical protein
VLDGLQAARYSVGLDPLPASNSPDFLACDVGGDGVVNVLDTSSISRYSVGLSVPDPLGLPILNDPPVAEAGGPYAGVVGAAVPLDGSASTDDHPPVAYDWDLDDDGSYETAGPPVAFACTTAGDFTVRLRVTDSFGLQATDPTSVGCSAPVDLYLQWTNGSGAPITTASAGTSVLLNVCTTISGTQAFQADVDVSGPLSRTGSGSDLHAATALGLCGDPTASDVVTQYTGQAPPANPFNFQDFSISATPGTGRVGLARVPFSAIAPGQVSVSLEVRVWALFSGQPPSSPKIQIQPLTID